MHAFSQTLTPSRLERGSPVGERAWFGLKKRRLFGFQGWRWTRRK